MYEQIKHERNEKHSAPNTPWLSTKWRNEGKKLWFIDI